MINVAPGLANDNVLRHSLSWLATANWASWDHLSEMPASRPGDFPREVSPEVSSEAADCVQPSRMRAGKEPVPRWKSFRLLSGLGWVTPKRLTGR